MYWDGAKLHRQPVAKALPIAEALYPGYALLFLFDNATSHSVYAKDALQAKDLNKGIGGKQPHLRNGWFEHQGMRCIQSMNFEDESGQWTQKGVQKVLEEKHLWPAGGLNLDCPKPKCFNCQVAADCKIGIKGYKAILAKLQGNTVQLTVQKLGNVMHALTGKKSVNVFLRSTVQLVQLRKENAVTVRIYRQNALPIVIK